MLKNVRLQITRMSGFVLTRTRYSSNVRPEADLPNDRQIVGHVIKHGESLQMHTDLPALGDPKLTETHPDVYTAANLILEFDGRC